MKVHRSRSPLITLFVLSALAGCRSDQVPSAPMVASPASSEMASEGLGDFQRYVAIGTSVSMGVEADGVYEASQRTAWPAQLAAMAHRSLTLPLIQAPGCQSPLLAPIAADRRLSGEHAAASTVCAPNVDGVTLPAGNVSVSAALTSDALSKTPETAVPSDYAGGRIYARVLAPGQSQVTAMLAQHPKVVSVELGANELLKARGGLVVPGTTVVPYEVWETAYDGVIAAVKQSGAKHVVLVGLMNDVHHLPVFVTGAELWDAQPEFAQLYVHVSADCFQSTNLLVAPVVVPTAVGRGAAAAASHQPMAELSCADLPGSVDYVLTPADQSVLTAQLRRMNARIQSVARENGYAYFDLDALFTMPGVRPPFSAFAVMFSPTPFGPYLSLDGFHPSAAGQTVLAVAAARALNDTYGMGIPTEPALPPLPASARGVEQSASGHGNLTVNGQFRTFSFTALRHSDGEVTGEFELKNHDLGGRMHGKVTCFLAFPRPEDPSRGALFAAGVVTDSEDAFPVGSPVIFNAFDNGEGTNALFPDFLSLMALATPQDVQRQCRSGIRISVVLPIEGGNIQVRP